MRYILAITSIHFPRFFKILEVTVMGTETVIGEATLDAFHGKLSMDYLTFGKIL